MNMVTSSVVQDLKDGTLWLLTGGSKGQYDMGWEWDALEVENYPYFTGESLTLTGRHRNIDSISDAEKYRSFWRVSSKTEWFIDHVASEAQYNENRKGVIAAAKTKLSQEEFDTLTGHTPPYPLAFKEEENG
jgi:hypothetical protein